MKQQHKPNVRLETSVRLFAGMNPSYGCLLQNLGWWSVSMKKSILTDLPIARGPTAPDGFPSVWTTELPSGITGALQWTVAGFARRRRAVKPNAAWRRAEGAGYALSS
jgi:hypothetical protein